MFYQDWVLDAKNEDKVRSTTQMGDLHANDAVRINIGLAGINV